MGKIEQHETRLDNHDVKINKIDVKVDVIDATTKGTASAVGALIKKKGALNEGEGTIQKGDWRGTLSSILATCVTVAMTAWSLWSIMYGETNPFWAYLSIVSQPTVFMMIKTLTGHDMKSMGVNHQKELAKKDELLKKEKDKLHGVMQMKDVEIFGYKEKIARLEERTNVKKDITNLKLPPN